MKNINWLVTIILGVLIWSTGCQEQPQSGAVQEKLTPDQEIFYLIMPRSFYDSNGDRIGDLQGVLAKLDYLQALGITSIIMTPLCPSVFYHNYFADDFEGIDPEYGTMQDYLDLISAIHARGMKFYMDTEIQYATKNHQWYKESLGHPESKYASYVLYHDSLNQEPEPIIYNVKGLASYNGDFIETATVNLLNKEVEQYMTDWFAFWTDPDGDGRFDDGVDGFRLDHMMDDLDHKGLLTNLFTDFWNPLLQKIKTINPALLIIAEQADWQDPGLDYFAKAGVDIVYSFGETFTLLDPGKFQAVADTLLKTIPEGKYQFIFLDNHDLDRFASQVNGDPAAERMYAALLYLSKGIPFIYYGQELGMMGTKYEGQTDGNDIPRREAFEWYNDFEHDGMALWYKDSGPWWEATNLKTNDGISVEEQDKDPASLLNFYRKILHLRLDHPGLRTGEEAFLSTEFPSVLAYCRWEGDSKFLLVFNNSTVGGDMKIMSRALPFSISKNGSEVVLSDSNSHFNQDEEALTLTMGAMGYLVVKME